jgi:hypothetical protein
VSRRPIRHNDPDLLSIISVCREGLLGMFKKWFGSNGDAFAKERRHLDLADVESIAVARTKGGLVVTVTFKDSRRFYFDTTVRGFRSCSIC